jgi:CDP-glucose 4,6-dehydratase
MHYLITGHTGFKGAWLTLMLTEQGHQVSGLALAPESGALFETAELHDLLEHDIRVDIRDAAAVTHALAAIQPDAVFHMAAQPLVRASYVDPRWTMETNVMGTFNVLEAVQRTPSVKANVVVTTDKVYRNVNQVAGYTEDDALGGHDPYSASKAMADLLAQSWVASFDGPPTAIARAGNVIGGGDVCKDRLLPDLLRAFTEGRPAEIRYPDAVRPWQHVLDCLNGYNLLMIALLDGSQTGGEWNFGPGPESFVTVGHIADLAAELWGPGAGWTTPGGNHPHEAGLLALDAAKARTDLAWTDRLPYQDAVAWTVAWDRESSGIKTAGEATQDQLREFAALALSRPVT